MEHEENLPSNFLKETKKWGLIKRLLSESDLLEFIGNI